MKYPSSLFCLLILNLFSHQLLGQKKSSILLSQETIFSPDEYTDIQISPDGKWISYIQTTQKGNELYISATDKDVLSPNNISDSQGVTSQYKWSADSKTLLFVSKDNTQGKDILYYRSIYNPLYKDKNVRLFEASSIQNIYVGQQDFNKVFVEIAGEKNFSNSTPLYQLSLYDNRVHEIETTTYNTIQYIFNPKDQIEYYITHGKNGEKFIVRNTEQNLLDTLFQVPFYSQLKDFQWNKEGTILYFLSEGNQQSSSLQLYTIDSTHQVRQHGNLKENLEHVHLDAPHQGIAAYQYANRTEWIMPYWKTISDTLQKYFPDKNIQLLNVNSTQPKIYFLTSSSISTPDLYQYEVSSSSIQFILATNPSIKKISQQFSPSQKIVFTSKDGTKVQGMFNYPSQQKAKNLPLVVWVNDRSLFSNTENKYQPEVQFLLSRGYAVLQLFYRSQLSSSTNLYSSMLEDIQSGVQAMIQKGTIASDYIAIMGQGIGGYLATAATAFYPQLFKAGINLFGTTDLLYSYHSTPDEWSDEKRKIQYLYGGNISDDILQKYSSSQAVESIHTPMLIAQDSSHPDVSLQAIKSMVIQLHDNNVPVQYLFAKNENFQSANYKHTLYLAIEQFLAKYIGGKFNFLSDGATSAIQQLSISPEVLKSAIWNIQKVDTFPQIQNPFQPKDLYFQVTYEFQGEKKEYELAREVNKSNNRWIVKDIFKNDFQQHEEEVYYTLSGQIIYREALTAKDTLQTTFSQDTIYYNNHQNVSKQNTPKAYFAQVAGWDIVVGTLPLEKYYHTYQYLYQPLSKTFQLVEISVLTEDTYNYQPHFVVKIINTANPDDYTLMWINKSTRQMSKSVRQISDKGHLKIFTEKK
ncbi:MAG: prolyl oligopeptidase family serine peptidase [Chitinophagales bacterium]|nr:prolyl oligopeptidase family serine peptidase [Chitinophagales bacterium]